MDKALHEAVVIGACAIAAGQTSYPISFELNDGPISYDGTIVNVDWSVLAHADIPFGFDVKTSQPISVKSPESLERAGNLRDIAAADRIPDVSGFVKNLGGIASGVGLLGTGLWLLWSIAPLIWGMGLPIFAAGVLCPSVFVIGGGVVLARGLRPVAASRAFTEVTIEPEVRNPLPGETLRGRIRLEAPNEVTLKGVSTFLVCTEVAIEDDDEDGDIVHRREVRRIRGVVDAPQRVPAGSPIEFDLSLSVPQFAPPSFSLPYNSVEWHLEVVFDLVKWPDLTKKLRMVVSGGQGGLAMTNIGPEQTKAVEQFESMLGMGGR